MLWARRAAGCCLALVTLICAPLSAQSPDPGTSDDWDAPINNVLLGGLLLGTLAAVELGLTDGLDEGIKPRPEGEDSFVRKAPRALDSPAVLGIAAATFLVGELADDDVTSETGLHTLETLALTSLVTSAVKVVVGRSRPNPDSPPDEFDSFNGHDSYRSFPSGHTSRAFALATVVTLELDDQASWIPFVAYPLATWVGVTRVLDRDHWPTDVLAGAALGLLTAQIWHGIRRSDDDQERTILRLSFPLGN